MPLTKWRSLNCDSLGDSWTTADSLENHLHRSFSASGDSLVILENDLKIHVFLAAVESVVAVAAQDTKLICLNKKRTIGVAPLKKHFPSIITQSIYFYFKTF